MMWNPLEQPFDVIIVNNFDSPGVAEVTKIVRRNRNEKIEPYGTRGAFLLCLGRRLVEFTVTLTLTTNEDWERWPTFRDIIDKTPVQPKPKVLEIGHPALYQWGVVSAVVEEIVGPVRDDETGKWKVEIHFLEFRGVPKVAMGKPKETKKNEPLDPYDALIGAQTQVLTDGKGGNRADRLGAALANQFQNHTNGVGNQ